jgi:16S rRNA processing protein RimM
VGCEVFDTEGGRVGIVREIWETGAHDVLVVDGETGGRHLLSTARELMPEVDLEARRIVVEILPGMLDADGER